MPSAQTITEVLENLRGRTLFDSECFETHLRVAEHVEAIYIDLGNQEWQAVRVTADNWKIINSMEVPVKFRRTCPLLPLLMPIGDGHIDELKSFVNVNEDDFILLKGWVVNCLYPN